MDSSDDVYFARFGRKLAMIAGSILFTAGAVVMAVATNKEILLVGR